MAIFVYRNVNLKPKTAIRVNCLANSRTFQDLVSRFPGLSSTKVIFQDFPGPGNFPVKIPALSMIFQEAWEPCTCSSGAENASYWAI